MLAHALAHVDQGWAVFPLSVNSKIPLAGSQGFKDATTDPAVVRRLWSENQDRNIAIATGQPSGIIVIDVDVKKGAKGLESLAFFGRLPDTLRVITPSGGFHLYYQLFGRFQSNNGILRGIDIKADGGYVVAAGSVINGKPYQYADAEIGISALPENIVKILSRFNDVPAKPESQQQRDNVESIRREMEDVSGKIEAIYAEYARLKAEDRPERILMLKCSGVHDLEKRRNRLAWQLKVPAGTAKEKNVEADQIERARVFPLDKLVPPDRGDKIICPLHDDHTPSMWVKGGFGYCFTCNKHLDSIGYMMKVKGLSFRGAVEALQ